VNCAFVSNSAWRMDGGAIYAGKGRLVFTGCAFSNNASASK
jgi:predicted outer membrane repeat protein